MERDLTASLRAELQRLLILAHRHPKGSERLAQEAEERIAKLFEEH